MSDEFEPVVPEKQEIALISHRRILVIMAVVGLAGSIAGSFSFRRIRRGNLDRRVLAFVNYYWLKISLKKIFELARRRVKSLDCWRLSILRDIGLSGLVVAAIYVTGKVSVAGVILGMGGFGFAVVIEGILRIFTNPVSKKEI